MQFADMLQVETRNAERRNNYISVLQLSQVPCIILDAYRSLFEKIIHSFVVYRILFRSYIFSRRPTILYHLLLK